jgi:nucleosome binding factor SPN SPT16 subunit
MLQREAMRQVAHNKETKSPAAAPLEGRRADESMKAFKTRIRNETRKTLHEELSGRGSTSQRRKEKMKELRVRKKEKKKKRKGASADAGDSTEVTPLFPFVCNYMLVDLPFFTTVLLLG